MYGVEITNRGGSKFTAKTKDCEFNIDTNGEGCAPPDVLLASLGSCIGVYIRKYAEGTRIDIPEFTVKVEGELGGKPLSFKTINVAIDLKGADIGDGRREAMMSFIKNCPIHNTLKYSPEIAVKLENSGR